MNISDCAKIQMEGHVRIWEKETGKVLLDKHNAVHPENLSYSIALALCGKESGVISELVFGNGGARATSSNKFIYATTQTTGISATLINETFSKAITSDNAVITHASGSKYSDIVIDVELAPEEPAGQPTTNYADASIVSDFTFSEIGLRNKDGKLLTHICHYPISKAQNITLQISYLLRIQVV